MGEHCFWFIILFVAKLWVKRGRQNVQRENPSLVQTFKKGVTILLIAGELICVLIRYLYGKFINKLYEPLSVFF